MKVYIVHGAPAAGKNRYVQKHREQTDIVVDLDAILKALGHERYDPSNNMLDMALYIREQIYSLIEARDKRIDCHAVWIITTLPKKKEREEMAARLKAELIHIDTAIADCIAHANADPERRDKQLAVAIIEEYFEKFQR